MGISRRSFIRGSFAAAGFAAYLTLAGCESKGAVTYREPGEKPKVSFFVISDTHVTYGAARSISHFESVMDDLASFEYRPQIIVINGDVTDGAQDYQYDLVKEIVEERGFSYSQDLLLVMGNHDQYIEYEEEDPDFRQLYQADYERFMGKTNRKKTYFDQWVGGYHFIALAPENYDADWCRFVIGDEQLAWLNALLEKDAKTGKPVFVCCHEPLPETVNGTAPGSYGYKNSFVDPAPLKACICKYPNVLYFSGHIHAYPTFALPEGDGPLFAHDGCSLNCRKPNGSQGWGEGSACGLQVNIYDEGIGLRTRDCIEGAWDDDNYYFWEWENGIAN